MRKEIQDTTEYWQEFDKPKIIYPEITWRAQWSLDTKGTLSSNTVYFIPCSDLWVLAVANSPINWWYSWRKAVHGKDEALRFIGTYASTLPVPKPTDCIRTSAEPIVSRLLEITASQQKTKHTILDWLRVEYAIEKPTNKLQNLTALDSDSFIAEVRNIRGKKLPLTAAGLQALRQEYTNTIEPARTLAAEALQLECRISDLVNEAYGLTPEEIDLMWKTAPPRMPIPRP